MYKQEEPAALAKHCHLVQKLQMMQLLAYLLQRLVDVAHADVRQQTATHVAHCQDSFLESMQLSGMLSHLLGRLVDDAHAHVRQQPAARASIAILGQGCQKVQASAGFAADGYALVPP